MGRSPEPDQPVVMQKNRLGWILVGKQSEFGMHGLNITKRVDCMFICEQIAPDACTGAMPMLCTGW